MDKRELQRFKKTLPFNWQAKVLAILKKKGLEYNNSTLTRVLNGDWENLDVMDAIVTVRDQHQRERKRIASRLAATK